MATLENLNQALQATQARMIALEQEVAQNRQIIERQTAEALDTANKLEHLEAEREKLEAKLAASFNNRPFTERRSIIDSKGLMRPSLFTGDRSKWRPEGVDMNEADMLNLVQATSLEIVDVTRMDTDLYVVLVSLMSEENGSLLELIELGRRSRHFGAE